jgi:uncharacterized membrane protein
VEFPQGEFNMKTSSKQKVLRLVQLAILVALIFVMQYVGTLVSSPFAAMGIELSFVLIPIVVGAFLLGPVEGSILGLVFGIMTVVLTIMSPGTILTRVLFDANPAMYTVVALVKAVVAGLGSGIIYKLLDVAFKGKLVYLRTLIASASAPVINTGIFLLGMVLFFSNTISERWAGGQNVFFFLVGLIWINFLIEFAINIALTPAIIRIVEVVKKKLK